MRLSALGSAALIGFLFCCFPASGQTPESPQRLHIKRVIPEIGGRVDFTASEIQRDLSSPASESILRLRGNVEMKMATCGPASAPARKKSCLEGVLVMHADAVNFNEKTGEIDATGNVHFSPLAPK